MPPLKSIYGLIVQCVMFETAVVVFSSRYGHCIYWFSTMKTYFAMDKN